MNNRPRITVRLSGTPGLVTGLAYASPAPKAPRFPRPRWWARRPFIARDKRPAQKDARAAYRGREQLLLTAALDQYALTREKENAHAYR